MSRSNQKKKRKRKSKRQAKQGPEADNCYICLMPVEDADRFHPCNCDFAPAHRECIQRWIAEDKAKCRVCNHYYDANRSNTLCFICNSDCAAPRFYPCECRYIVVHQQCLNQQYDAQHSHCPYCRTDYTVNVRTQHACTTQRCRYPLYALLSVLYISVIIFLIAPLDILKGLVPIPAQQFQMVQGGDTSILLFPAVHFDAFQLLDTFYLTVLGMAAVFAIALAIVKHANIIRVCSAMSTRQKQIAIAASIVGIPILHVFGNIHYRFYCAVGVIPAYNCFWLFNWASFFASIPGILLIALPILFLVGLALLFKWLFIKRKEFVIMRDAIPLAALP